LQRSLRAGATGDPLQAEGIFVHREQRADLE
jgi:hypothetical protein